MPEPGTIIKEVVTRYRLDDAGVRTAAPRVERAYEAIGRKAGVAADKAAGLLRTIGRTALLGTGGAGGLAMLGRSILQVGVGAESSTLRMTGLIQKVAELGGGGGGKLAGFGAAAQAAGALRMEIRRLAVESPVTAKDISESWEAVAFNLSQAGLSLREQVELSRSLAVADMNSPVKGVAARDVAQLLAGIGGTAEINTAVLKPIAKEAAALAKSGDLEAAVAMIRKQLTPSPELLAAFGKSVSGMWATVVDRMEALQEKAAGPLTEALTAKMRELLDWMERNGDEVDAIVESISEGLVSALEGASWLVQKLYDNWDAIVSTVTTLTTVWIGGRLIQALVQANALAKSFAAWMVAAQLGGAGAAGAAGGAAAAGATGAAGGAGAAAATVGTGLLAAAGVILGSALVFDGAPPGSETTGRYWTPERLRAASRDELVEGLASAARASDGTSSGQVMEELRRRKGGGRFARLGSIGATLDAALAGHHIASATGSGTDALDAKLTANDAAEDAKRSGGSQKVRRMTVEKLELPDEDLLRLAAPSLVAQARADASYAGPIGGLGLGLLGAAVGR